MEKKNAKENQSVETRAREKGDPTTRLFETQGPYVTTSVRHILEDLNTTMTSCLFLPGSEESCLLEATLKHQLLVSSFFFNRVSHV